MMNIKVIYKIENKFSKIKSFNQVVVFNNVSAKITKDIERFIVELDGEKEDSLNLLRLIWELACLYEGYFYTPIEYIVDNHNEDINELNFLSYYKTSKIWKNASVPLVDQMEFSLEILFKYHDLRNTGRESKSLLKVVINAFYYLRSEDYEKINVNHMLSLFLNLTDGFYVNFVKNSQKLDETLEGVLSKYINIDEVKQGLEYLGIHNENLISLLRLERNEIDHYSYKENSISECLYYRSDDRANYVNWYFIYVIELALRMYLLEAIGCSVPKDRKDFAMNNIIDWVIIECDLDVKCKNPLNVFKQEFKKRGIEFR